MIGEVSAGLKAIAKDMDIPVVALCQVGRSAERRDEKTPTLADLRESGNIEQDADIVLFLNPTNTNTTQAEGEILEIKTGKNRNGPTGRCSIIYFKAESRMENGY